MNTTKIAREASDAASRANQNATTGATDRGAEWAIAKQAIEALADAGISAWLDCDDVLRIETETTIREDWGDEADDQIETIAEAEWVIAIHEDKDAALRAAYAWFHEGEEMPEETKTKKTPNKTPAAVARAILSIEPPVEAKWSAVYKDEPEGSCTTMDEGWIFCLDPKTNTVKGFHVWGSETRVQGQVGIEGWTIIQTK